jgi:hypothetical protein
MHGLDLKTVKESSRAEPSRAGLSFIFLDSTQSTEVRKECIHLYGGLRIRKETQHPLRIRSETLTSILCYLSLLFINKVFSMIKV